MKDSSSLSPKPFVLPLFMALFALCMTHPALAEDIFTAAKATIKDTAGTGSGVEMATLAFGALGAAIGGFTTRNWYVAGGSFAGGMIFWEVVKPLVGLA